MEHVEDFKSWLMYGKDYSAVPICQFVEVMKELNGGGSIKTYTTMKNVRLVSYEHATGVITPHPKLVRQEKSVWAGLAIVGQ